MQYSMYYHELYERERMSASQRALAATCGAILLPQLDGRGKSSAITFVATLSISFHAPLPGGTHTFFFTKLTIVRSTRLETYSEKLIFHKMSQDIAAMQGFCRLSRHKPPNTVHRCC